ncbi:hypothetical protein ETB97_006311 [Aspergillus alliaceus]|uniref:DUF4139 domain-containing protein n=1 Tax=Petromyces alliaceus TaxID=209559 RepID=A0A8H5ZXI4_PETAA|nr:hypothetical protein ETB97_006311 [Aspergillus burnettii]
MAEISTSEILLSPSHPTKSVTFTPQRATIVREIHTSILSGQHELTISGLDPKVDVDSIRIEGTGAATITDIQTEIVPRREMLEDVYPVVSDEGEGSEDLAVGVESEGEELGGDDPELRAVRAEIAEVEMYARQRAAALERYHWAGVAVAEGERELDRLARRRDRIEAKHRRAGQVVVHLDSQLVVTPGSSRRSSIFERSYGDASDTARGPIDVTLRLSYVVPGVRWSPRYELRINTPSSSARMAYRAELRNSSSETWKDARVTLSTSQASFSGLEQRIPSLQPWHIKLLDAIRGENQEHPSWQRILNGGYANKPVSSSNNVHYCRMKLIIEERDKFNGLSTKTHSLFHPRSFGGGLFGNTNTSSQAQGATSLFGGAVGLGQSQPASSGTSLFGAAPTPNQETQSQSHFGGAAQAPPPEPSAPSADEEDDEYDIENESLAAASLEHQESVQQDYGLTTTYDLPGHRTLIPSNNNRRHILADLDLKSVTLSHIIVPKHSAEAFSRAQVKNTSSLRILRGKVGLTVDETFLGTATIPNCTPSSFFNVSFGVDPSILVTYGKPTVRRLNGGFFTGQVGAVFRRTGHIKNTKSVAVDITVLDQVPVSEDKELQVEILEPKGLDEKDDGVKLDMEASHGSGKATMEKKGEVKWAIHLEPGRDVRVVLEYGTKAPRGREVDSA